MSSRSIRHPKLSSALPFLLALAVLLPGCAPGADTPSTEDGETAAAAMVDDPHSFSHPEKAAVTHLDLDLTADFESRVLAGRASLSIEASDDATELVLDTRNLEIRGVTLDDGTPGDETETEWSLGEDQGPLGQALTVAIGPETRAVHVDYATTEGADAVQWLNPAQTAGGEHPFLFTQSQAILARTWVPIQDTPGVRFTYDATVRVPPELLALMSADNPQEKNETGEYSFRMPQAIPSYLLALAIGDLEFRALGPKSGVYAEPSVIESAAWELADTPEMITAAEELYGPYRWGRYDVLFLPPSFPFGGMENPRLTFATPTILAGDRSLVALVAHELAHSWSGNLVTNSTWNDIWLNEGFTTYFESRIMEAIYGREVSEMLATLNLAGLRNEVEELDPADTRLSVDLEGRDPDEGLSGIPYDKGMFFLRTMEETVGRERFDAFLSSYFDAYAFQPMDSARMVELLKTDLLTDEEAEAIGVDEWVYGTGIPDNLAAPSSDRFDAVDAARESWQTGTAAAELETGEWTTHEWLHFLRGLPAELTAAQLADLDAAFELTETGNAEIRTAWYLKAIPNDHKPIYPSLEEFLIEVGRRKFLAPLYRALAETDDGEAWARDVYERARPGYHSVSTGTIDGILDWQESE